MRRTAIEVTRYRDIAAASAIEPSLTALREAPKLWNVLAMSIEPAEIEMPVLHPSGDPQ